ncbi:WD40-repeat-containing domain protein [Crassisporium funariophilum]|nr:WD40-repeat-containing domain protein [Crassisporium funariophilum]
MDSLIAKAHAVQPLHKKRKTYHLQTKPKHSSSSDQTLNSVAKHTSIPKSLQDSSINLPDDVPTYKHIANKKLRTHLNRQSVQGARSQVLLEDAEMLLMEDAGGMEVEGEMGRTWRVGQNEVVQSSGLEAAKGRREYKLDGGPYSHLAIVGNTGHVSTFDWQTGTMHAELQLQETCRDITLEFLPYHWLLASVSNSGYLKYQDTSTGQLLASHRTKLGSCTTMAQNLHNAVIHLGHQNGQVTLWTPNLPHPAVQVLAHLGPVVSVSVDPSAGGRYMATAGRDGTVKVWDCRNWKGAVRDWTVRGGGEAEVEWSARGYLAVANGGSVNVYNPPSIHAPFNVRTPPPLYMTHPIPHRPLASVRFVPFQDILTIGHSAGLSSILVPGSGEPNFDKKEVKALLDKIQPDMIMLDPETIGTLAPPAKLTVTTFDGKPPVEIPYARLPRMERLRVSGKADETEEHSGEEGDGEDGNGKKGSTEEREKRKMRGKGKSLKRYLRKQRKNVVDPAALAIRAKLEKQKEDKKKAVAAAAGDNGEKKKPSALDRFKRSK